MGNVAEWIWAHADSDRTACVCAGERWSYRRLHERSARYAAVLREAIDPGDRLVLIAPSRPEFVVAYYAGLAAGAQVVPMNPMATAREVAYALADAECSLALAWHECAGAAQEAVAERGGELWRIEPGALPPRAAGTLAAPHPSDAEDTAVILYTSGTSGQPKGAELSHRNVDASARSSIEFLGVTAADQLATALPLFHVFGGAVVMGSAIRAGASLALLPQFTPAAALSLLAAGEATILLGVPTMFNALLQATEDASCFSSLRYCLSGGAALPEEVLRAFEQRFDTVVLEGYGLTEVTGAATFGGFDTRKVGYVGVATPGMEVRVVDEASRECDPGEVGEVVIRGPQVMNGYRGRPEATAEAIRGEWFHSGDLGAMDAEGRLRIVDRKKDLVIRGGYNVYPREVEEAIYEHPDVVEAAVIGVADPHYGEEVAAIVALRDGSELDGAALRSWVKQRLSAYKAPRLFQFVDELPKGATGKILKRAIEPTGLVAPDRAQPSAPSSGARP